MLTGTLVLTKLFPAQWTRELTALREMNSMYIATVKGLQMTGLL